MKPQTEMMIASAFSLAVGLGAGLYALWPSSAPSAPQPPGQSDIMACKSHTPSGPYEFGTDYFTTQGRLDAWNRYLKPLAGKPVHYLEVGLWKGQSMVWMLDNVLKHRDSTATGIDIVIYPLYMQNLVRTGACEKVRNLQGRSQDVLHTLPKEAFDVIYIDGSHLGQDVLVDAVLAFDRLKVGGLMIFDDYKWYTDWATDIRPGVAIDSFVTMYRHELEIVHRDYQMIVRKKDHPCEFNKYRLTPVGHYCYQWVTGELVRQSDRQPVKLLPGEKDLIAEIARSAPFGETAYPLDTFKSRPEFQALNGRLHIFDL